MSESELPWLNGRLAASAGALAPAARGFLVAKLGHRAREFRGGSSGVVFLCEEVLRFLALDHVSEDEERVFVEGAGALLGLLLIDHAVDAAHVARGGVHRVRLGAHGYFDPFSAMDRVLDAPSPRQELMRQLELAEAERRGEGPIARVVRQFLGSLARERPELAVIDHFDLTLTLRGPDAQPVEVDLRRAVDTTRDQDAGAAQTVAQRLVSMLPGGGAGALDVQEARQRLMPRLLRSDALRDLATSGKSLLANAPLCAELSIALLLEYEGRARYVRERELAEWGLSWAEAFEQAWRNLARCSKAARIGREETPHGPLFLARTGDGRDSARVVLPALHAELRARVQAEVALALPHRDTFMACAADNAELVALLRHRAEQDASRAPHRLSEHVYRFAQDGLRPFDP
jgi:hypothetical protein